MSAPDVGVFGAGAWGAALALVAARAGANVALWSRSSDAVRAMEAERRSPRLLDAVLPPEIRPTAELGVAAAAPIWILATPAQTTRDLVAQLAPFERAEVRAVCAAKGLETRTGALQTEIVAEALGTKRVAALSGPGFARDIAKGLPAAVTVASRTADEAQGLCQTLASEAFRPYASDDLIGVQMGGALKNVLAIACGAVMGLGLGESARAALLARGFAEIRRLAVRRGGRPQTLGGLSGLGDAALSCMSESSRNYAFGLALGQGASPDHAADPARGVVEGAATARAAAAMGRAFECATPVADAVTAVLGGTQTPRDAVIALMTRPLKSED